jgi:putative addiction module component (TIGR02574 family)
MVRHGLWQLPCLPLQSELRMDLNTILHAARQWPVEDRLELVFGLWDQLVEDGWQPEPSEQLIAELDRRLAAHEADPTNVRTREQVLERLRKPQ